MPAFLVSILINLVLKLGLPFVIDWLKRRWGISVTSEEVEAIIQEHQQKKRDLHAESIQKLKECTGVGCPPDLK